MEDFNKLTDNQIASFLEGGNEVDDLSFLNHLVNECDLMDMMDVIEDIDSFSDFKEFTDDTI